MVHWLITGHSIHTQCLNDNSDINYGWSDNLSLRDTILTIYELTW